MRTFLLTILCLFAFSFHAKADFLNLSRWSLSNNTTPWKQSFFSPNEYGPQFAVPLIQGAPEGVYITVGTERAFTVASSTPEISHLLIVDADPMVILFNKINIALLKASPSQKFFREFRLNPTPAGWIQVRNILESHGDKDSELFEEAKLSWWIQNSTTKSRNQHDISNWNRFYNFKEREYGFSRFNPKKRTNEYVMAFPFAETQYMFNKDAYKKISLMAKTGRIQVETANFSDTSFLNLLNRELIRQNLPITVLDISNCWKLAQYMSPYEFKNLIKALAPSMTEQSRLIISQAKSMAQYLAFRPLAYMQDHYGSDLQVLTDFIFAPESLLNSTSDLKLVELVKQADQMKLSFLRFQLWEISINQVVDQEKPKSRRNKCSSLF